MQVLSLTLLSSVFAIAVSAHAESVRKAPPVSLDPSCLQLHDTFEVGYRFSPEAATTGGKCLNTAKYRAITNLAVDKTILRFDNFMSQNVFWHAELPVRADIVEKVYFQIIRFPVIEGVEAAHTELRFKLAKDALKISRSGENAAASDLLVSFEGALPPGEKYNFAMGTFDAYALIARVTTSDQKLSQDGKPMEQYELKLDGESRLQLLINALKRSSHLGYSTFYNTLRPNCTTEVFDLLDSVPAIQGKADPFLTMISLDPVAAPSINGLRKRGILVRRVQNYNDEVKGTELELPVPEPNSKIRSFFPQVAGQPWAISVVGPAESELTPAQSAVLKAIRDEVSVSMPSLVQSYASVLLLRDRREVAGKLLAKTLQTALGRLPQVIRRMDSQLPNDRMSFHIYFVPMASAADGTSLSKIGVSAAVPFPVKNFEISSADRRSREIFFTVGAGTQAAANQGAEESKFAFFAGFAITAHLQRGQSSVITQIVAGLDEGTYPIQVENAQVKLSQVVIPRGKTNNGRALAILSHVQDVKSETVNPEMIIDFGPWGGIAGQLGEFGEGTFQVFRSSVSCDLQQSQAPSIQGVFGSSAMGKAAIDKILAGRNVNFNLLRVRSNIMNQTVTEADVRISTMKMQCLEIAEAEKQFGENMTSMMQDAVKGLNASSLMSKLIPFF